MSLHGNPDLSLLGTIRYQLVQEYTVEAELESQLDQQKRQYISSISSIKFKTAFEELNKKRGLLATGIEKIDSLLQLASGDRLAIVGNRKYSQILVTRLCVNALLSSPSKKRINKREADIFTRLI
jgi:F0F1-type ATP synthase alpha subunit